MSAQPWSEAALRLLARAGRVLGASLDLHQTLADLGTLLVPGLVDAVLIQLCDPETCDVVFEFTEAVPGVYPALKAYITRYPPDLRQGSVLHAAIASREPVYLAELTEDELRRRTANEAQLATASALGVHEAYAVPLLARGRVVGAISFMNTDPGRRMGPAERLLADELGARAALTIDTVQLLELSRRTVAALQQSEQLARSRLEELEATYATAPVGLCVLDTDLRFVRINQRMAEFNGRTVAEHIGRRVREVIPAIAAVERMLEGVLLTGEPVLNQEIRGTTAAQPGVERVWLESWHPLRRDDGEIVGITVVAEEITEQKEAEAALRDRERRLRAVLDQMPSGVIIARAPTGRVIMVNAKVGEIWRQPAVPAADQWLVGEFPGFHLDGRPYPREEWPLIRALRAGEVVLGEEIRIERGDGTRGVVAVNAGPIRGDDGDIVAAVMTLQDITRQHEVEERLRQSSKMEAIGRLAGGLAHDFNNQLHALSGFAELVGREPGLSPAGRENLAQMRQAADGMARLTRQLLAFSRQQVLLPEVLDLNHAVREGLALVQRLLGDGIVVRAELCDELCWVRVDRAQLLQVVLNLAINARDAMPAGGQLTVRTACHDGESGGHAELSVSDTGVGIEPANLSRVFDPFFTTKELGNGTGLGLATVHGVVTQSGGRISVESRVGHGTRFTIQLPLSEPPAHAEEPPSTVEPESRPARILLVEDQAMVRDVLRRTLELDGHEVMTATHGVEALERLATAGRVDLLVSDVVMPVMSGAQLDARLEAEYPDLPVLWISGYPRESFPGRTPVPDGFLQKPVSADRLAASVNRLLSAARGV